MKRHNPTQALLRRAYETRVGEMMDESALIRLKIPALHWRDINRAASIIGSAF